MNLEQITRLIDDKIEQNSNKVVITFYEMKIKHNLSDEELIYILNLIATRLINLGYKVYKTNQKYTYSNKEYKVERNELLIAIKQ